MQGCSGCLRCLFFFPPVSFFFSSPGAQNAEANAGEEASRWSRWDARRFPSDEIKPICSLSANQHPFKVTVCVSLRPLCRGVRACVRARVRPRTISSGSLISAARSPAAPAGRQLLLITALRASGRCESARSFSLAFPLRGVQAVLFGCMRVKKKFTSNKKT